MAKYTGLCISTCCCITILLQTSWFKITFIKSQFTWLSSPSPEGSSAEGLTRLHLGLVWGSGLIPGYARYSSASGLTQNLGDTIRTTVYTIYPAGDRCQVLVEGHAQVKF